MSLKYVCSIGRLKKSGRGLERGWGAGVVEVLSMKECRT